MIEDDVESRVARIIAFAQAREMSPRGTAMLVIAVLAAHGFLIRLVIPDDGIPY